MKHASMTLAAALCALGLGMGDALAAGTHAGGHGDEMAAGSPGKATAAARTVDITLKETDEGMAIEPASLQVKQGETIRFQVTNTGEIEHEFVIDTHVRNQEHKKIMAKFPEMEHDDPNSVRLDAGGEGEVVWTFSKAGTFEFACLIPGHYESGMHGDISVGRK
ncbi:cupredoxin domain-containing protein [Stappia sp.]|uniref:cupredoxin domain-containing protein n=1 Tax=Stappia sp. TaxID=1870903 RepID=UPI003D103D9E